MEILMQLRKFWRFLAHRKGYNVHSPFVFKFITTVIEERLPYYSFFRLKSFYQNTREHHFWTIREEELIFRIADRMRINNTLLIGPKEQTTLKYLDEARGKDRMKVSCNDKIGGDDQFVIVSRIEEGQEDRLLEELQDTYRPDRIILCNLKDKKVKSLWTKLILRQECTITIDMVSSGIAFTNNKLNKQHYKAFI